VKAFSNNVFINQERRLGDRKRCAGSEKADPAENLKKFSTWSLEGRQFWILGSLDGSICVPLSTPLDPGY